MIGGAVLGLKRKDIMRKFESIVDFSGIGDFMEQPIKLYSSGMRLRLAFAISVHADAEILIVDEALSVGDAAFQKKCIDWIDKFRQTGTLLFVSHSPGEVARLCQNSIWIDDGRVRAQGNSTDIVKAYNRAVRTEEDTMKRFSVTA
jgi:lipopolysaccharide transport system ATP-binding protein